MTPEEKLQHLFAAAAAPARDPVFEAETALRVARRRAIASAAASIPLVVAGAALLWLLRPMIANLDLSVLNGAEVTAAAGLLATGAALVVARQVLRS